MKEQIITMLEMQDAMNSKVHPQWREQDFAWYRAIWVECAELMDHYGWKWWKKQTPDMEQVILELIDIWHFGLSICLKNNIGQENSKIAETIQAALDLDADFQEFKSELEAFTAATLNDKDFDVRGFACLMNASGLSFEALFQSYVGKNVLNFFRQDHGYKEGTYRKVWDGKEDNIHLVEALEQLDASSQDFKQALYNSLKQRYEGVEA